jgi:hypothetical protein
MTSGGFTAAASRRSIILLSVLALLLILLEISPSAVQRAGAATPPAGGTNRTSPGNGATTSNPLKLLTATQVQGGYVSSGIGMRNLGYGTITLTGIPSGSTIDAAYLLWDEINSSDSAALAEGTFDGTAIKGSLAASGSSPCWPSSFGESGYANYSYEANVTSMVQGNGSYRLSGFASGSTAGEDPWTANSPFPELEGASLVAIYKNAAKPETTVQVYNGATETDSGNLLTQTLSGFSAGSSATASTTFIVADGQSLPDSGGTFNGTTLVSNFTGSASQAVAPYSEGDLWDNDTSDVSSLVKPGDTTATATVDGTSDCLVWVGQVFSVSSVTHYELNLKLWIPQPAVVDPVNPAGTMPYGMWKALVLTGLEPDLSHPSPVIGPFGAGSTCKDPDSFRSAFDTSVSSTLDGDGYTGYNDGTSFRAAAKVSFDWNGSSISNISFEPEAGVSHRAITEETRIGHSVITRSCTEYHVGTVSGSATAQGPSELAVHLKGVVGFLTGLADFTGAHPSSRFDISVSPDGSLGISYESTRFPTTGLQVLINNQVEGTNIVNDASCYKPSDVLGFRALAFLPLLFDETTKGTLPTITLAGPPTNVDIPSPGC